MERKKIELKNISYKSAVFFGIITVVLYLIMGIIQISFLKNLLAANPDYADVAGSITPLNSLVIAPLASGAVVFILALVAIFIYNIIAKKFPISFDIANK